MSLVDCFNEMALNKLMENKMETLAEIKIEQTRLVELEKRLTADTHLANFKQFSNVVTNEQGKIVSFDAFYFYELEKMASELEISGLIMPLLRSGPHEHNEIKVRITLLENLKDAITKDEDKKES